MSTDEQRAHPTEPRARMLALDALRGLALLGIALVNVPWIGYRESLAAMLGSEATRRAMPVWDLGAALFVEGLCEGRFYPIFSILFGLGTGLLIARGLPTYGRRIAALIVLGVLHASFGWYGDILLNYAAAGIVLVGLSRLRPRVLVGIALALLVLTQLASLRFDGWLWRTSTPEDLAEHREYVEKMLRGYRDGTFVSITKMRLGDLLGYFTSEWNISYRLNVLAMTVLGLALERARVHGRLGALRSALGRCALVASIAGLVLAVSLLVLPQLYIVAGDVLALGYASGFLYVATRRDARWLHPLACVGRMALTCYLFQTLAFTLFFYGYGLGMYGAIGPLEGVLLALAVYTVEAILAVFWLGRFEYGPMEWLWRAATYLRAPPMRRG